jgi:hypothetical protein
LAPVDYIVLNSPLNESTGSYREIEEETGFLRKTIERWIRTLRTHGYIETQATQRGVVMCIKKAKKFAEPTLKNVGGARKFAGRSPQFSGRPAVKSSSNQQPADRIRMRAPGRGVCAGLPVGLARVLPGLP